MELGIAALWGAFAFLAIMLILVSLHLSHRINALYARQQEHEETTGYAVSCAWRYVEAVDDEATDGAGTRLYLSRLPGVESEAGQHDRY